jgi:hypothetical protein
MSKKKVDLLQVKSKEEILLIIEKLGAEKLTRTGHGFKKLGEIPIREAAEKSTTIYSDKWKIKPALGLISVVLAANRDYNKVVEPNLEKIEKSEPDLKNFKQLSALLENQSKEEFYFFWGHKDEKKYRTLKSILEKVEHLRNTYPNYKDDFDLLYQWGLQADLLNYKQDIIGSISNIAVATFQHLRMVFGVDTVKPDQRVKEVLDYEFGLTKLPDKRAIKTVEQIAELAGLRVITIDQIFVKYGSSYYNQKANKLTVKQIAQNLKSLGVDNELIRKATLLTSRQILQL